MRPLSCVERSVDLPGQSIEKILARSHQAVVVQAVDRGIRVLEGQFAPQKLSRDAVRKQIVEASRRDSGALARVLDRRIEQRICGRLRVDALLDQYFNFCVHASRLA
jgi:hypothetical protein